jgi:hypothetical protein
LLLSSESGTEFDDITVGVYHPAEKSAKFLELKDNNALAFDSLPLYVEPLTGVHLVQSNAIIRYIARTKGIVINYCTACCKICYNISSNTKFIVAQNSIGILEANSIHLFIKRNNVYFRSLWERCKGSSRDGCSTYTIDTSIPT